MKLINLLVLFIFFLNCSSNRTGQIAPSNPVSDPKIDILVQNLEVPWGMDFLPDGRLMFNERPGRINVLDLKTGDKKMLMKRDIHDRAEGGLLGLAVDPSFSENHFVFIYETVDEGNRIVRLKFENEILTEDKILLDSIPKKLFHDGGILKFGPDGFLYAGTGDARTPENAQDLNSLSGKILRLTRDGEIPADNPFKNYVWSYGHRNVQGLCWDKSGNMFASEHGPSGELNGWCCHDELNIIVKGGNYGWPFVIGEMEKENTILPIAHSGEDTWAPGGIELMETSEEKVILMACLRGEQIRKFTFADPRSGSLPANAYQQSIFINDQYGRLRNILKTPDGHLIFCSSNRDGRGDATEGDDKIFLIKQ